MASSQSKKNRLIIFDFDGTIADTIELNLAIFNQLADKYGYRKVSIKKFNKLRDLSYWQALKQIRLSWWKLLFFLLFAHSEGKRIASQKILSASPFKGMIDLIGSLKKSSFHLGIVTNNAVANVKLFLEKYNLDQFEFIIENKNIFNKNGALCKAIKKYDFPKENIYYIGDEVKDIKAAKKNGLRSIAVGWGYNTVQRLAQENPHFLVNNLKELRELFFI